MSEYSWCEHISKNVHTSFKTVHMYGESYWTYSGKPITDSWDICPVAGCHKPRPKEVSLREQLIQKLNQEYLRFVKAWEYEGGQYPSCGYLIPKLVDICLEFLKGKI